MQFRSNRPIYASPQPSPNRTHVVDYSSHDVGPTSVAGRLRADFSYHARRTRTLISATWCADACDGGVNQPFSDRRRHGPRQHSPRAPAISSLPLVQWPCTALAELAYGATWKCCKDGIGKHKRRTFTEPSSS
jgi:hypothetical protein